LKAITAPQALVEMCSRADRTSPALADLPVLKDPGGPGNDMTEYLAYNILSVKTKHDSIAMRLTFSGSRYKYLNLYLTTLRHHRDRRQWEPPCHCTLTIQRGRQKDSFDFVCHKHARCAVSKRRSAIRTFLAKRALIASLLASMIGDRKHDKDNIKACSPTGTFTKWLPSGK
jgi:hypothetical protein